MTVGTVALFALDCREPRALADFYRAIVGGEIKEATATEEWVRLQTPNGADLGFQLDPTHEPPGWPDGPAQQAHVDIDVADLDEAEATVIAIGARKAGAQPDPTRWRVFLDLAGHPFCLCKA